LTKPINLPDLRQAVERALAATSKLEIRKPKSETNSKSKIQIPQVSDLGFRIWNLPTRCLAFAKERVMPVVSVQFYKTAGLIAFILVILVGIGMFVVGVPAPWRAVGAEKAPVRQDKTAKLVVERVQGKPHTLAVPEDARRVLGISTPKGDLIAVAKKPSQPRFLVMPGSTMLDPTRLYRIRARFAASPSSAEVTEIANVHDESSPVTTDREIRTGDRVKKGDRLAVFHSVDVGNKKNDLIDSMYQLDLDQQIFKKAEEHRDALPQVFLWNAERQFRGDQNNINRALATLRSWGITEKDIQLVQDEAKNIIERKGKRNPQMDAKWPRVELTAPDDGVIVERNLALHEIVADNTTNLFQIARVDRLAIVAYCPEDNLPELEKLKTAERRWTVSTVGSPPVSGAIDDIGYIIDPNQHTAVVKGHIQNIKNEDGEEVLRAGQFIEAKVKLPLPTDVVEVPIDAISEDGQQAVVFVVTDRAKHHYTMRRVQVEARFDETAYVRSKPFDKSVQPSKEEMAQGILPKEPLHVDDEVLPTGVGELKAKLLDLESQPDKK
jgi:cobalt-zinc-cadmium efflux system membrane fusion protein